MVYSGIRNCASTGVTAGDTKGVKIIWFHESARLLAPAPSPLPQASRYLVVSSDNAHTSLWSACPRAHNVAPVRDASRYCWAWVERCRVSGTELVRFSVDAGVGETVVAVADGRVAPACPSPSKTRPMHRGPIPASWFACPSTVDRAPS